MATTTSKSEGGLSQRGWANVEAIMPKISAALAQRVVQDNPNIDLATAENWLIRDDVIAIAQEAIAQKLSAKDLSYPRAFAGFPEVLAAFAAFFNQYFKPRVPVEEAHLATAPGAASCIDTLLYNVCDPGEGVLVPAPFWNGFDFQFKARSSAVPIPVNTSSFATTIGDDLIPALEEAIKAAIIPVRALLLCNPQNPLSRCYPVKVMEDCIRFCQKHDIHYISDEVYALTTYKTQDIPEPQPFVSALALDVEGLGCDPSRVHVVWSTSKDFGQSGIRMGCSITQANKEMAVGLALASNTQTSTLSSIAVAGLLTSPKLPQIIERNSRLLAENYEIMTAFLRKHDIEYFPADAGLYLMARVAPKAASWEDESAIVGKIKEAGVLVSAGRAYHGPESEKGWARVGFAVPKGQLIEAVRRMEDVYAVLKEPVNTAIVEPIVVELTTASS